jgi:hypothetical protein
MIVRAGVIWLVLLVIAVTAGIARTLLLEPRVGEQLGHVIGTALVIVVFSTVIWLTFDWVSPLADPLNAWVIGLGWVMATMLFEFLFGHYVDGAPWSRLVADYNVLRGRLWILVPLTLLFVPVLETLVRRRELAP